MSDEEVNDILEESEAKSKASAEKFEKAANNIKKILL